MKIILLNRHAEAAVISGIKDFDRPLTSYGVQQAQQLTAYLQQQIFRPQYWISSTALRALTTAQLICRQFPYVPLATESTIYEATEQVLFKIMNDLNDKYSVVGLTGHNPAISYLLYHLCSEVKEVPPCSAMHISFEADSWKEISAGTGTLNWYYTAN